MLCCLPVYGGHTCEFLVSKSVSLVRFVNMLRIAHKHPQDFWNHYPLLKEGLDLGRWISSLGYHLVLMGVMPFGCMYFRGRAVECQTSCTVNFLGYSQIVWPA